MAAKIVAAGRRRGRRRALARCADSGIGEIPKVVFTRLRARNSATQRVRDANYHHPVTAMVPSASPKPLPETAAAWQSRFAARCCVVASLLRQREPAAALLPAAAFARHCRHFSVEFGRTFKVAATRAASLRRLQVSFGVFRHLRPRASQGATLTVERNSARRSRLVSGSKIDSSPSPNDQRNEYAGPAGKRSSNGPEIAVCQEPNRKNRDLGFSDRSDRNTFNQDPPATLLGTPRPRRLIRPSVSRGPPKQH